MNKFLDAISVALSSVWTNKLRSFMMVLGNVVAVTSIIAVVSLIRGMDTYVANAIVGEVGAGTFRVERVGFITSQEQEERARALDLDAADGAPALGLVAAELVVVGRHPTDADVFEGLAAKGDVGLAVGLGHHGIDVAADRLDRPQIHKGHIRVLPACLLLFFLVRDHPDPGDLERADPDLRHDGVGNISIHALDQGHDGDDRRHRHHVAEHHHERPELVGPDR